MPWVFNNPINRERATTETVAVDRSEVRGIFFRNPINRGGEDRLNIEILYDGGLIENSEYVPVESLGFDVSGSDAMAYLTLPVPDGSTVAEVLEQLAFFILTDNNKLPPGTQT